MLTDLRLALRSLSRARGYAIVALLSLAVGLGATTTVFSLVDALAFRPLPFPAAVRSIGETEVLVVHASTDDLLKQVVDGAD